MAGEERICREHGLRYPASEKGCARCVAQTQTARWPRIVLLLLLLVAACVAVYINLGGGGDDISAQLDALARTPPWQRPGPPLPTEPAPSRVRPTPAAFEGLAWLGPAGETDAYGYPLRLPDRLSVRALLLARRFDDLTRELEALQRAFEADFTREMVVFEAFEAFATGDPDLAAPLEAWIAAHPTSFAPHLAHGVYVEHRAGLARGGKFIAETSAAQLREMERLSALAAPPLKRALALHPNLQVAYHRLGMLANMNGQRDALQGWLKAAEKACPDCYRVRLGHLIALEPRWGGTMAAVEEAARAFAARGKGRLPALRAHPASVRCAQATRAEAFEEALPHCEAALARGQLAPYLLDRAQVRLGLARASDDADASRGHVEAALEDLDAALRRAPRDVWALRYRAVALERLKRLAEAEQAMLDAARVAPLQPEIVSDVGRLNRARLLPAAKAWLSSGEDAALVRALDVARRLDAEDPRARCWDLARGETRPAAALHGAFLWTCDEPWSLEHYVRYDYALAREGRFDDVVALWGRYGALNGEVAQALLERGGAFHRMGRAEEARADVTRACELKLPEACLRAQKLGVSL